MDKQLKELGKQIGGLGNKFGTFAEGLAYGSIKRILQKEFKMNDFIAPGVIVKNGELTDEYDVLAYSNGTIDKAMIVEIKSRLNQRDIDQMKRKMDDVFKLMPEHKNKTFYGMVAYVTGHENLKKQNFDIGGASTTHTNTFGGMIDEVTFYDLGDTGDQVLVASIATHHALIAVPEPSTTALLSLGGLTLILRRRK